MYPKPASIIQIYICIYTHIYICRKFSLVLVLMQSLPPPSEEEGLHRCLWRYEGPGANWLGAPEPKIQRRRRWHGTGFLLRSLHSHLVGPSNPLVLCSSFEQLCPLLDVSRCLHPQVVDPCVLLYVPLESSELRIRNMLTDSLFLEQLRTALSLHGDISCFSLLNHH